MKYPKYDYSTEKELFYYQFESSGVRGTIKKVVEFHQTSKEDVYNLAFGDLNEKTGKIDDKSVTNNGDSLKVLATVTSTVYAFTSKYPNSWIFATGSTSVRTRLYRMGLTNNLDEISVDFDVYGLKDEIWEKFVAGEDYEAFLVRRKK